MDHSLQQLAGTHESWRFQVPLLSSAYRVLRYDSRGHGASSSPPGPYTFDILVPDVICLMDHYGIAKADILGLSMGGMTALGLAIDHPDRVGRVICCARSDSIPPFVDSWNARVASIREAGGMKGVLDFTLGRGLPRTSIKSSRKSSRKREARFSPPIRRATSPASRPSRSSTTRAAWERFAPPLCSSSARRMRPLRRRCCARWRR
jgi:pimeloyl-ACP methyl ester carboxylesterase